MATCPKESSCALLEDQIEMCDVVIPCPRLSETSSRVEEYNRIVSRCSELIDRAHLHEIDKIAANLALGALVADILKKAKYGDRSIENLARDISKKRGKTVYPQRLYEAYEVWSTVKTMEKVEEIQKKTGEDITWNWLVKNSTRDFQNEPHEPVKKEKIEKTLKQIESAADKIEKLSNARNNLDDDTKKQVEGVMRGVIEAAKRFIDVQEDIHDIKNNDVHSESSNGDAEDLIESNFINSIVDEFEFLTEIKEILDIAIQAENWEMVKEARGKIEQMLAVDSENAQI